MLTDDELIAIGRARPGGLHPWGVGSTREDYLRAVRAIIAAHTAKLRQGVELPLHVQRGNRGEYLFTKDQLLHVDAAAEQRGYLRGLEDAKRVCNDLMAPPSVGGIANANLYHDATEDCADAIEKLKVSNK